MVGRPTNSSADQPVSVVQAPFTRTKRPSGETMAKRSLALSKNQRAASPSSNDEDA